MSFILLGILNSQVDAGGNNYWIGTFDDTDTVRLRDIGIDSDGNILVTGATSNGYDGILAKVSPSGSLIWQRQQSVSFGGDRCGSWGIGIDSSNNSYIGLDLELGNFLIIAKHNSSGTLQWQRQLEGLSGSSWQLMCATADTNGNTYFGGRLEPSTNAIDALFGKYDSSGVIQHQRRIGSTGGQDNLSSVALDSSNNPHFAGYSDSVYAYVAKFNNALTTQWQRELSLQINSDESGIELDSSDNVYSAYRADNSASIVLFKHSSSGSLTWQRAISGSGMQCGKVAIDSLNNIYVIGNDDSSGNQRILIVKFDSSGNTVWQRYIQVGTGTFADNIGLGIKLDANDDLIVSGVIADSVSGLVMKIPSDGSLTGTYNLGSANLTYDVSTNTISTPTYTQRSFSGWSSAALTRPESASSATDSAGVSTYELTTI